MYADAEEDGYTQIYGLEVFFYMLKMQELHLKKIE